MIGFYYLLPQSQEFFLSLSITRMEIHYPTLPGRAPGFPGISEHSGRRKGSLGERRALSFTRLTSLNPHTR